MQMTMMVEKREIYLFFYLQLLVSHCFTEKSWLLLVDNCAWDALFLQRLPFGNATLMFVTLFQEQDKCQKALMDYSSQRVLHQLRRGCKCVAIVIWQRNICLLMLRTASIQKSWQKPTLPKSQTHWCHLQVFSQWQNIQCSSVSV